MTNDAMTNDQGDFFFGHWSMVIGHFAWKVYEVQDCLIDSSGVHLYTTYMTSLLNQLMASQREKSWIVIDWTARHDDSGETLLNWVRTSPQGQKIHVFLPSRCHGQVRTLQNALQSMGCIVTRKKSVCQSEGPSPPPSETFGIAIPRPSV